MFPPEPSYGQIVYYRFHSCLIVGLLLCWSPLPPQLSKVVFQPSDPSTIILESATFLIMFSLMPKISTAFWTTKSSDLYVLLLLRNFNRFFKESAPNAVFVFNVKVQDKKFLENPSLLLQEVSQYSSLKVFQSSSKQNLMRIEPFQGLIKHFRFFVC